MKVRHLVSFTHVYYLTVDYDVYFVLTMHNTISFVSFKIKFKNVVWFWFKWKYWHLLFYALSPRVFYLIIHDCELFDRLQNIWYRSTHFCLCKYLDWWLFWSKNLDVTGSAEQFSKWGADPPILKCRGRGELVVGLWTLKMVNRVPTRYLLIQLRLINNFFNSLTNEKGVSNKKV